MMPQKSDLPVALNHVLYEMEMLHAAAALLKANPKKGALHNAFLECFLVHARCLDEFFCKPEPYQKKPKPNGRPPKKPDDTIQPHHFVPYTKKRHSLGIDRMHKEISHLSFGRKKAGEIRDWDIQQILAEVAEWSLPFLTATLAEKHLTEFKEINTPDDNKTRIERQIAVFRWLRDLPKASPLYLPSTGTAAVTAYVGSLPIESVSTSSVGYFGSTPL